MTIKLEMTITREELTHMLEVGEIPFRIQEQLRYLSSRPEGSNEKRYMIVPLDEDADPILGKVLWSCDEPPCDDTVSRFSAASPYGCGVVDQHLDKVDIGYGWEG